MIACIDVCVGRFDGRYGKGAWLDASMCVLVDWMVIGLHVCLAFCMFGCPRDVRACFVTLVLLRMPYVLSAFVAAAFLALLH